MKVLATVDESTYDEQDGNTIDDDHPIAWCSDFDGGRSWYTGMGHTQASFSDANFRNAPARRPAHRGRRRRRLRRRARHAADRGGLREGHDQRQHERPDGDRHRRGRPRVLRRARRPRADVEPHHARRPRRSTTIPVTLSHENGLLGIQLAPGLRRPPATSTSPTRRCPDAIGGTNRVSRFTLTGNTLGQEQIIYTWQHQRQECCHTGGSLEFGARRRPLHLHGRQHEPVRARLQPDRRAAGPRDLGRPAHVGQHEQPERQDPAHPADPERDRRPGHRARRTRSRTGNLFPRLRTRQNQTLPEIYAMGFRNPFRIHVDQKTGWVLMGDYGPDAGSTDPNRGPQGSVEYNVVKQPGFYGWPYCIRENVPYHDITYTANNGAGTDNGLYNCNAPVNDSPNNTGLTNLPPAHPGHDVDGLLARLDAALPRPRRRRRPDGRHALLLRRGQRLRDQVPEVLRRALVHRRVEQRLDQDRDPEQPGARHRRRLLRDLHGLHQPDGHGVRPGRLAVRRRVGPGLQREQP